MLYLDKIADHAKNLAHAPALSEKINDQWQHISWAQLWQQSRLIAAHLKRQGVKKGDRIAILANNCRQWTLVDFACMSLGAVSVPIYPTSTPDQIHYILQHCGAKLIFAEDGLVGLTQSVIQNQQLSTQVINMSITTPEQPQSLGHWLAQDLPAIENAQLTEADLLTIVYTSGTTGKPKGVMLTHGNLMAAVHAHLKGLTLNQGDRSFAVLPLSHIFERGWTFILLFAGGQNHYLNDMQQLQTQLKEVQPHVFCAVPRIFEKIHTGIFQKAKQAGKINAFILRVCAAITTRNQKSLQTKVKLNILQRAAQALANALVGKKIQQALGGHIRFIPCGGAALDHEIHSFFMGMGVNIKIGYGMTETLATVSFMQDKGYTLGTLGQPMKGIDIKIDPASHEILIRSPSMTQGYYKDPEATKQLIQQGWLHTGDAGHLDDKGNLVFQERLKELMKTSGGKYIAPTHVEGVLIREQLFEQVAIIADTKNYASALIVPAWEALEEMAKRLNIHYENRVELILHSTILEAVEQRLQTVQAGLARYEQVKKFTLLPRDFSVELGEITPTLKLRRKVIMERFKSEIAAMYPS